MDVFRINIFLVPSPKLGSVTESFWLGYRRMRHDLDIGAAPLLTFLLVCMCLRITWKKQPWPTKIWSRESSTWSRINIFIIILKSFNSHLLSFTKLLNKKLPELSSWHSHLEFYDCWFDIHTGYHNVRRCNGRVVGFDSKVAHLTIFRY